MREREMYYLSPGMCLQKNNGSDSLAQLSPSQEHLSKQNIACQVVPGLRVLL